MSTGWTDPAVRTKPNSTLRAAPQKRPPERHGEDQAHIGNGYRSIPIGKTFGATACNVTPLLCGIIFIGKAARGPRPRDASFSYCSRQLRCPYFISVLVIPKNWPTR